MVRTYQRKKRSVIWQMDKRCLAAVVASSSSFSQILKHFNLLNKGGNIRTLQVRLDAENIDTSHLNRGIASNQGRTFDFQYTLGECFRVLFIVNSKKDRKQVKRYLQKYSLIPYQCECGLKNEWRGRKINLQLDHKNGVSNDNRIENLRWLCPNCHSQTSTFSGRNIPSCCNSSKVGFEPNSGGAEPSEGANVLISLFEKKSRQS